MRLSELVYLLFLCLFLGRAEEKGHFRKTVDVYCNTPDSPLRLVVTGMAE